MDAIDHWLTARHALIAAEEPLVKAAKGLRLSPTQAVILVMLLRDGPQPINRPGRTVGIQAQSMTEAADRLERAGYAERVFSKVDRRIHELRITDAGRSAAATFLARLAGEPQAVNGPGTPVTAAGTSPETIAPARSSRRPA